MLVEYHRNLLSDKVRNDVFYRALKSVIRPGESLVADVGSGTGLLGFLARKLGARDVYAYEFGEVMDLARRIAQDNKIDHIHFIAQHSKAVKKPVSVDIIISETLGNLALEEHIIDTVEDAKRFLKPGGVIIPNRIVNFVAPVVTDKFHRDLTVWDDVGFDLNYAAAKEMSFNNLYVRTFTPQDILGTGQAWDTVDFSQKNSSRRHGEVSWQIESDANIYGLCAWWTCDLVPGIDLSTSPLRPKTHWEQLYFPVAEPILAKPGDKLSATIESHSSYKEGTIVTWKIALQPADGEPAKVQSYDLRKGYLG